MVQLYIWPFFVVLSLRSGRRIRKTRKYDIITTPAERVEMAPLNEDNDDEDDSTLFDVKYRFDQVSKIENTLGNVSVKVLSSVIFIDLYFLPQYKPSPERIWITLLNMHLKCVWTARSS